MATATKGSDVRYRLRSALSELGRRAALIKPTVPHRPREFTVPRLGFTLHFVEDELDGGYVVSILEVPGCMSQGDTIEEAVHNVIDALYEILSADIDRKLAQDPPREHKPRDLVLKVGA